nr:type II secretion system F family protein [Candidatus Gracilibacteria bacterium]
MVEYICIVISILYKQKLMINFSEIKEKIVTKIKDLKSNNQKLNIKEKINFLDQFGTLLNSGIPITSSLKIISFQTKNKGLKSIIETILGDINKGTSLKDSFSRFPYIFKIFDLSIIEMGELTGKVGEAIDVIKLKEEKTKEIKSKIIGAFVYPSIIITLALGMITIFIIYVIPKITDMYKDARVNLPILTQSVINISDFLQKNIIYICLLIILFIIGLYYFKTNDKTKIYFDKFTLKLPIAGNLIKKKILSLFTSSLGTLLKNGVIINKSLEVSAGVVNNDYYKKEILKMVDGISAGEDFSKLLGIEDISSGKENIFFPLELASAVKIGEQTGRLPDLLLKISNKYNKEMDETVKNLSTAIEPIVIIFVGIIIGTLIMAIMLPFFNMVNVI